MSTEIIHESPTLKGAAADYWSRVKAGDIGALPAILGLIALCGIFGAMMVHHPILRKLGRGLVFGNAPRQCQVAKWQNSTSCEYAPARAR